MRLPLPAVVGLTALLLPGLGSANPLVVEPDLVGPRWEGVNFHDNFGWYVRSPGDLDGDGLSDFLAVGPQDDGPSTFDSVLRVFLGRSTGLPQVPAGDWSDGSFIDAGTLTDEVYHFAVVPDATGDGRPDVLVSEPNTGTAGGALLYAGDGDWEGDRTAADAVARWNGFEQTDFPALSPTTRPSAVAGGDLDDDGLSDVVIASVLYNRVWIDYSSDGFAAANDLAQAATWFTACEADFPGAGFGSSIAVGDLNDDGIDDLVVGAPGCAGDAGEVHVFYGGIGGVSAAADLVIGGGDRIGNTVEIADVDADGVADLMVQELQTGANENRGGLWIFFGDAGGLPAVPDTRIRAGFSDRRLGASMAVLADISNPLDGRPELVVGAPEASYSGVGQGAIYVFEGLAVWPAELEVSAAKYRVDGAALNSWFGQSVATLDDFDGDGYPEIVVGEPNFSAANSENEFHRGRVYLVNALPDRDEDDDGISTLAGDCNDHDTAIRPGLAEQCNGVDDNCNHEVDEGCEGDDDDATGDDDTGDDDTSGDDDDGGCDNCEASLAAPAPAPLLSLGAAACGAFALRRRRTR